jgi:nucleoside-diphosphate-sugar epimerase
MSKNQKALLSGATGFIGEHLALRLIKDGWTVGLLVRDEERLAPELRKLCGDDHIFILNGEFENLSQSIQSFKPEIVFHLASLYQASHKSEDLESLIESNLRFPTLLLEAVTENNIPYFINCGSAGQHFNNADYDPLSLSTAMKQAFEDLIEYYVKNRELKAVTLKFYDTYGPNDPRLKILNVFAEAAKSGKTLPMGDPAQELNLVYIDDVVFAFLSAAKFVGEQAPQTHNIYAVQATESITLQELVSKFETIKGVKLNLGWNEIKRRGLAKAELWRKGERLPNWKPKISLETGLKLILK